MTTSWFDRASEAFTNEYGRLELLDGVNPMADSSIPKASPRSPDT
ncbi:hypothetical protein ACIQU5_27280 [Streptomyces sp. NPDC090306]